MALRINKQAAISLFREEATQATSGSVNPDWVEKIEQLSQLCEEGVSKTHIAFLGTAILAKAMASEADLFAIKPEHAKGNPNAFSARTLCHGVIVPLAAELGINIGVTGREPLNNRPYFRMTRLGDTTPVHAGGRAAFDYMLELVKELHALPDEESARAALRAYIAVRRRYQLRYADYGESAVTPEHLTTAIQTLVTDNSEGGRRAQAVAAGLLDVFASEVRVESGRINDPSRKYPGDVCIRAISDSTIWEKAFEVRDKPVSISDIHIFVKKCADMGVREAAVVMVSERQEQLEQDELQGWARDFGIGLTLFIGWSSFVDQVLFWAELPKPVASVHASKRIYERLIAVEASPESIILWGTLVSINK